MYRVQNTQTLRKIILTKSKRDTVLWDVKWHDLQLDNSAGWPWEYDDHSLRLYYSHVANSKTDLHEDTATLDAWKFSQDLGLGLEKLSALSHIQSNISEPAMVQVLLVV